MKNSKVKNRINLVSIITVLLSTLLLSSCEKPVPNEELIKRKTENLAFLQENEKNTDVITTKSGLQYKVLKAGEGKQPSGGGEVKVHYEGKLINGEVFDSSFERNEPLDLPLDRVIKGWQEGIPLMKEGATYEFYIPYNLGYGERGSRSIPPYATLIFKVELIEIL